MFRDFVDLVVPELERRGACKSEYSTGTLREQLFGQAATLPRDRVRVMGGSGDTHVQGEAAAHRNTNGARREIRFGAACASVARTRRMY
jgi:hypothetical protein